MEMEIDFKSFYMNVRKQWKELNSKLKNKLDELYSEWEELQL